MTSLKGLQRTLRKRLVDINRWRYVSVLHCDSQRMPCTIKPFVEKETFIIRWYGPKRKNIHREEWKMIPMGDIDEVAERNRMRLRNKTKTHR